MQKSSAVDSLQALKQTRGEMPDVIHVHEAIISVIFFHEMLQCPPRAQLHYNVKVACILPGTIIPVQSRHIGEC